MRARKSLRSIPCNCNCVAFNPRNSIHSYGFHRPTHCLIQEAKNHTKFVIHDIHDMFSWFCMILKDFHNNLIQQELIKYVVLIIHTSSHQIEFLAAKCSKQSENTISGVKVGWVNQTQKKPVDAK